MCIHIYVYYIIYSIIMVDCSFFGPINQLIPRRVHLF